MAVNATRSIEKLNRAVFIHMEISFSIRVLRVAARGMNNSGRSRVVKLCDYHTNETALHSRTTILEICQNRGEMGRNELAIAR